jgi:hypothetical protein
LKRIVLTLAALLAFSTTAALAAPINDLGQGRTALGAGTDNVYLEHQVTSDFTLGVENVDRGSNMGAVYGQFRLSDNLKGIVGSRDLPEGSKVYAGMAVHGALSPQWNGYASLVGSGDFNEVQVGASHRLAENLDLNVDYHNYSPDRGSNKSGVGVGATLHF